MTGEIRFAPKDAKIIKDNPGKSPYELKELGLSDPAFEKLMSQDSTAKKVVADENLEQAPEANTQNPPPAAPDTKNGADNDTGKQKLIPKLESPTQAGVRPKLKSPKGQVWVQTPSGKRNLMGETFARKLVRQDRRYKII